MKTFRILLLLLLLAATRLQAAPANNPVADRFSLSIDRHGNIYGEGTNIFTTNALLWLKLQVNLKLATNGAPLTTFGSQGAVVGQIPYAGVGGTIAWGDPPAGGGAFGGITNNDVRAITFNNGLTVNSDVNAVTINASDSLATDGDVIAAGQVAGQDGLFSHNISATAQGAFGSLVVTTNAAVGGNAVVAGDLSAGQAFFLSQLDSLGDFLAVVDGETGQVGPTRNGSSLTNLHLGGSTSSNSIAQVWDRKHNVWLDGTVLRDGGSSGNVSVDWGNRVLNDSDQSQSLNWAERQLSGNWTVDGGASLRDASSLFNTGTIPAGRLGTGLANSTTVLHGDNVWRDGTLHDGSSLTNLHLGGSASSNSIAQVWDRKHNVWLDGTVLRDSGSSGNVSVDWGNRVLLAGDGQSINWDERQMDGNWTLGGISLRDAALFNTGTLSLNRITGLTTNQWSPQTFAWLMDRFSPSNLNLGFSDALLALNGQSNAVPVNIGPGLLYHSASRTLSATVNTNNHWPNSANLTNNYRLETTLAVEITGSAGFSFMRLSASDTAELGTQDGKFVSDGEGQRIESSLAALGLNMSGGVYMSNMAGSAYLDPASGNLNLSGSLAAADQVSALFLYAADSVESGGDVMAAGQVIGQDGLFSSNVRSAGASLGSLTVTNDGSVGGSWMVAGNLSVGQAVLLNQMDSLGDFLAVVDGETGQLGPTRDGSTLTNLHKGGSAASNSIAAVVDARLDHGAARVVTTNLSLGFADALVAMNGESNSAPVTIGLGLNYNPSTRTLTADALDDFQGEFWRFWTNIVLVDAGRGSDTNGLRGQLNRPFATIGAAQTNALPGDTVVLRGSIYIEAATNALVNYFLERGAQADFRFDRATNVIAGEGTVNLLAFTNSVLSLAGHSVTIAGGEGSSVVTNHSTTAVIGFQHGTNITIVTEAFVTSMAGTGFSTNTIIARSMHFTIAGPNTHKFSTNSILQGGTARISPSTSGMFLDSPPFAWAVAKTEGMSASTTWPAGMRFLGMPAFNTSPSVASPKGVYQVEP